MQETLLTRPLLLYSSYMCAAEAPVLSQNLPLPAAEMLGSQAPEDRAEVLRLWLVVLLEGQRSPHPGILVIDHVILNPTREAGYKKQEHMLSAVHKFNAVHTWWYQTENIYTSFE